MSRLGRLAVVALMVAACAPTPSPSFSASGRIVFSSDRDGGATSIYILDVATGETTRLTTRDGYADVPRWSPDGTRVAFTADWVEPQPPDCQPFCDVWVVDADGDHLERLSRSARAEVPESWSPDGATLLIDQFDFHGNLQVVALDVAGSDPSSALTSGAPNGHADWSPDGTTLVFTSLRDGDRELYLMASDGTDQRNLTRFPAADDNLARWSPDGTRIVFHSERDGNREVYVMDADGGNLVRLTNTPGDDWFPEWSPDGRQIVFVSSRDGDDELYLMAADGTDLRQLTFNDAIDGKPDWAE